MIEKYKKFYVEYLRTLIKYQIVGLLICVIYSISNIIYPLFLEKIIDEAIADKNINKIIYYTIFMGSIIVVSIIFKYLKIIFYFKLGKNMGEKLKANIIMKLFHYGNKFYNNYKIGEIISIIEQDVGTVQNLYMNVFNNILVNFITIIGLVFITIRMNVVISAVSFGLVGIYIYFQIRIGRDIKKASYNVSKQRGILQADTQETLENSRNIYLYNSEKFFYKRYRSSLDEFYAKQYDFVKSKAKLTIIDGIFEAINLLVVLFIGGIFVVKGLLSVGGLFTLTLYVQKLFAPVMALMGNYIDMKGGQASIERINEIMDSSKYTIKSGEVFATQYKSFELRDIGFSYGDSLLFKHVNVVFKPGDKIAFVGDNGTGKSTLVNILFRLEEGKHGKIYYNGNDIYTLDDSYYQKVFLVSQTPFIFSGTIKENLLLGKYERSDDELYESLDFVNLKSDVLDMKDGLDTIIGNRGVHLSGGQKQKLALARIFMETDNSLIILDEPTSSLDTISEIIVMKNLIKEKKNSAIIIITHRKKVIEFCNKIMKIENSCIMMSDCDK